MVRIDLVTTRGGDAGDTSLGDGTRVRKDALRVEALDGPARMLLIAGKPLREPVVARGPFAMNTDEQIAEAYADLRAGRFTR